MKPKVHIEHPMFSKNLMCRVIWEEEKGIYYTWPIDKEAFKQVTCKTCRKIWNEFEEKRLIKEYMKGFDKWVAEHEA